MVTQRPLKERVIHLLALKPYRKPELLLWLDRERAPPRDKADLGPVLDEVCMLYVCVCVLFIVCVFRCV